MFCRCRYGIGVFKLIIMGLFNGYGTKEKKAEQHDKDMAALNQQYWMEQQDYINAYNDPSQQVQRMEAAGINPNLALQQVSAGNAGDVSGGKGTTQSYAAALGAESQERATDAGIARSMGDIANDMSDVQTRKYNAETQRAVAHADIALKAEEKGLISEKKAGQVINNELETQFGKLKRQSDFDLNKAKEEEAASNAWSAAIRANNDSARVESETAEVSQKIENMKSEVKVNYAKMEELKSSANLNNELAKKAQEDARYAKQLADSFKDNVTDVNKAKIGELNKRADYLENRALHDDMDESTKTYINAGVQVIRGVGEAAEKIYENSAGGKAGKGSQRNTTPDMHKNYKHERSITTKRSDGSTQVDKYTGYRPRNDGGIDY